MSQKILMIAGPNGSGKTTMAYELMSAHSTIYDFINADEIAKGLAPLHPEGMALTASKLMVKRLKELLMSNKSFAFETTGAGVNYIKHLKQAKSQNYMIHLTFLWLASPEDAVKRVSQRVKQGGHSIPEEIIVRRYFAGIKNLFRHYIPLIDAAFILDNSQEKNSDSMIIATKNKSGSLEILDPEIWKKMEKIAHG